MRSLRKGDWDDLRGTWKPLHGPYGTTALVGCPECGKPVTLTGHEIKEDGTVSPSLVCPHRPCQFHDFIKLEGWDQGTYKGRPE